MEVRWVRWELTMACEVRMPWAKGAGEEETSEGEKREVGEETKAEGEGR